MSDFYNFDARAIDGKIIKMSDYQGKVVLVVNTASKCGFTPQYEQLEKLYKNYKDSGFVILGFPCDQFGNQEPGNDESISQFCQVNYGVSFQMFSKIEVNGKNEHPIYGYLKNRLSGVLGKRIKWNFTKFLIDQNGEAVKRFAPNFTPEKITPYIEKLL